MGHYYSSSHSSRRRAYWGVLLSVGVVLLILIATITFFGYRHRVILLNFIKPIEGYVQQTHAWLLSQKAKIAPSMLNMHASVEKAKPVHFEFYSALPEMQVSVPEHPTSPGDKPVRLADNARSALPAFAFSRDELVKEFEDKLDPTSLQGRKPE